MQIEFSGGRCPEPIGGLKDVPRLHASENKNQCHPFPRQKSWIRPCNTPVSSYDGVTSLCWCSSVSEARKVFVHVNGGTDEA